MAGSWAALQHGCTGACLLLLSAASGRAEPSSPSAGERVPLHGSAPRRHDSAAEQLLGRGVLEEQRGAAARALVAYTDALALDPSLAAAWLALGRLRAAIGDDAEAERVLSFAARLPDVAADALSERAALRRRSGRHREAVADLTHAIDLDPALPRVRRLSAWLVEQRAWPAALALWRRFAHQAEEADDAVRAEAVLQVRALMLLTGEVDPVAAGARSRSWVRRSLAHIARRAR